MNNLNGNGKYLPKTVGIVYSDVQKKYFPSRQAYLTEKDAKKEAQSMAKYLEKIGIKPFLFAGNDTLPKLLKENRPQVVINLVDSFKGIDYMASAIPGVLDLLEIPYTGAGILGQSLNYNKFLTKKLFEQNGIPVPRYQLMYSYKEPLDSTLRYPLITKLNGIHGAVEITFDSISFNEKHLRQRVKHMTTTYDQPVLIEEFIVGREISAALLEGLNKKVYMGEILIDYPGDHTYSFKSFELQWQSKYQNAIKYQKYNDPILVEYVKKAFNIADMADYARFDIRLDNSGRYFFIDANTNPYIGPLADESPFTRILDLYDVSFTEILKRLLINTVKE